MYKEDLALNNLQGLICHETQPTNNMMQWLMNKAIGQLWVSLILKQNDLKICEYPKIFQILFPFCVHKIY